MEFDINYLCISKIFNIYQEKILGLKTFSVFKVILLQGGKLKTTPFDLYISSFVESAKRSPSGRKKDYSYL